jgi:hypothetical protein
MTLVRAGSAGVRETRQVMIRIAEEHCVHREQRRLVEFGDQLLSPVKWHRDLQGHSVRS